MLGAVLALRGWKLGGFIAGLLALAAIIAGAVWLIRDHDRLREVERKALACEAAVKNGEPTTLNCPQAISNAATRGQRYLDCDAAIAAGDLYATRAACSAAVKRRDAQATALAAGNRDLATQLAAARDQLTGGLARAAARNDALIRKDRNAQAVIAGAPRAADGRITCDDRCLRDLTGD
jgi:hypothetical protein